MTFRNVWTRGPRSRSRRTSLHVEQLETRVVPYALSGDAWPNPQLITLSFVPDGTILGSNGSNYLTSNLFAKWNAHFGSAAAWQNQVLRAAQTWAQQTNINFTVVADDGASIGSGNYQQGDPGMGDIRVGGYNFGGGTLAQAEMPPPVNNYSVAGDVQFNTGVGFNIGTTYDLDSVALHEIGHALGLYHSSTSSAAMYGIYTGTKTALNADDIAGIRAIYSGGAARSPDAYDTGAGDNSFATAANLTSLIDPNALTALVPNLNIATTSDVAYYTFTAPANTSGTLTATVQSQGLSLLAPKAWVYAADQSTVLAYASGLNHYGTTLTLTVPNVTAGQQLYLKVAGADTSPFGTGAYAVTLNFGTGASPVVPLPNTTVANGNPIQGGGGIAEVPPAGAEGPGRDVFPDPDAATTPAADRVAAVPAAVPAANVPAAVGTSAASVPAGPTSLPVSQGREVRPGTQAPAVAMEGAGTPTRILPAVPAAAAAAQAPTSLLVVNPAGLGARPVSAGAESGGGADRAADEVPAAPAAPAAVPGTPDAPQNDALSTPPGAAPEAAPAESMPMPSAAAESAAAVAEAPEQAARFSPAAVAASLIALFTWSAEPGERGKSRRRAG